MKLRFYSWRSINIDAFVIRQRFLFIPLLYIRNIAHKTFRDSYMINTFRDMFGQQIKPTILKGMYHHTGDTVMSYKGHDELIYGGMIIDFLLAAEKYSGYDITEIKEQIEDKRLWLKATFPDAYQAEVRRDRPFFD